MIRRGNEVVAKLIHKRGANIETRGSRDRPSLVSAFHRMGDAGDVKLFSDKVVGPETMDAPQDTPLHETRP